MNCVHKPLRNDHFLGEDFADSKFGNFLVGFLAGIRYMLNKLCV